DQAGCRDVLERQEGEYARVEGPPGRDGAEGSAATVADPCGQDGPVPRDPQGAGNGEVHRHGAHAVCHRRGEAGWLSGSKERVWLAMSAPVALPATTRKASAGTSADVKQGHSQLPERRR